MPPPPRAKLYGKSGKHKSINQSYDSPPSTSVAAASSTTNVVGPLTTQNTDSDADRQFELELCWCIQTLEASLDSGKLNAKAGKQIEFYATFPICVLIIFILQLKMWTKQ